MDQKLLDIFREVFDDDELEIGDATAAADVDGWDSLAHINLVVAIESGFGVSFAAQEITALENVGDLKKLLAKKLAA